MYNNKYIYKLETHLEKLCNENSEYKNLISTQGLNKEACKDILSNIVLNYPSYSVHNNSHSEKIISNIEMLLGEDRIKSLSPTDTWLILHAAYMHDVGMAILFEDIHSFWKEDDFKEFWEEQKLSVDDDLKKSILYIESIQNKNKEDNYEITWPLEVRKYVTYIISCYFRGKHASLSKKYLREMSSKWKTDLSHNGLIPNRLIYLLGEVSFLHTQSEEEVLKLDYLSNGYNADYIHPRFVAEMLRFGDLLDADNGRFNQYTEFVYGEREYQSEIHNEKHESTRHILITPEWIEFSGNCKTNAVYREVRNWLSWLEDEIKFLTMNWVDIVPKDFLGHAPKLGKTNIFINGKQDLCNVAELRFHISQEKAFDIIEGYNIYDNKYIFVRELIQNSLDAIKIKLWRDINDGNYNDIAPEIRNKIENKLCEIEPFDLNPQIFKNYYVNIETKNKKNGDVEVIVSDNGIGISLDTLKLMSEAGNSYQFRRKAKMEINQMPNWLRPTGGFGIGIHSVFLVADEFEIKTNSGERKLEIKVRSRKSNGYFTVKEIQERMKIGTEIRVLLKNDGENFGGENLHDSEFNIIGKMDNPFSQESINLLKVNKEIEDIYSKNGYNTFFNIIFNQKNNIDNDFHKIIEEIKNKGIDNDKYKYVLNHEAGSIKIWIKKESIYCNFVLDSRNIFPKLFRDNKLMAELAKSAYFSNIVPHDSVSFKGMMLTEQEMGYLCVISTIDIYGFDTKKSLSLNRYSLLENAYKEIKGIVDNAFKFFIKELVNEIDNNIYNIEWGIDTFAFLIKADRNIKNFKTEKYIHMIKDGSEADVRILIKKDDKFNLEIKTQRFIFEKYPDYIYVNGDSLIKMSTLNEKQNLISFDEFMSRNFNNINDDIIVDEMFSQLLSHYPSCWLKHIKVDNIDIILQKPSKEKNRIVEADEDTINYYINLLDINIPNDNNLRNTLPVFDKYKGISVSKLNEKMKQLESYKNNIWVISPFKKGDNFVGKSKEEFIENIINRNDFMQLLNYVLHNKTIYTHEKVDDIKETYKKLIEDYCKIKISH